MKSKDKNENNLNDFIELNMLNFSFEKGNLLDFSLFENKLMKKTLKKINRQNLRKCRRDLRKYKISQKKAQKTNKNAENLEKKESRSSKRIKRCNDKIIASNLDYKDIYLTIDKFNTNGKKTVAYFIDSFFPVIDGVVSVLDNYAKGMQKYYNVVVCAPKHRQSAYKMDDYFVLYSDSLYIKSQGYDLAFPQLDAEFQKIISHLKIDFVHVQSPFNMGNFGLSLAKRRKIPCFASFHSQFKQNFQNALKSEGFSQLLTSVLMYVYKRSDLAITMNSFAKGVMREYGYKKDVKIIPNATNLVVKDFDPSYEQEVLDRYKIDKNEFNMIFIGRFVEVKNVYFILNILKELYKINPNFNFIFLGFGPEQTKMQKFAKDNGLDKIIKFTGKVDSADEKAILIKNSKLLVFPSIYDTDGIVRIECACYSVPTICIEKTGVASVIKDNHNGFIEKNDVMAFVNRIDGLIKNVDFLEKVGKNANLEIYNTWDTVCEKLRDVYEEFLVEFKNKKKKRPAEDKKEKVQK